MTHVTGEILENRYRIVSQLGQGGFVAVYRAWDLRLEMPVAIKQNLDVSQEAQRQFGLEAKMLARLQHSNLPIVRDYFFIPDQGQYLVMDFVEGEDLQAKLDQSGGSLPMDKVLPWILQVCDVLSYLHEQQPAIIHLDVKPANIRIRPPSSTAGQDAGKAMLVGFGIASVYDPKLVSRLGAGGIGSVFSSLEQYRWTIPSDARMDIYALGATLYKLLTGEEPISAHDRNLGKPLPLPRSLNANIPSYLSAVIMRSMEMLPEARFQSIAEMKNALEIPTSGAQTVPFSQSFISPENQASLPPPAPIATRRFLTKINMPRRLLLGVGSLIVLVIIIFGMRSLFLIPSMTPSKGRETSGLLEVETFSTLLGMSSTTQPPTSTLPATSRPITATLTATLKLPTLTSTASRMQPTITYTVIPGTNTPDLRGTQIVDKQGITMALVPAGEFLMGSDEGDEDERPVHAVYLDDFYMDIFEVTNQQYANFLNIKGNQWEKGGYWLYVFGWDARIERQGGFWRTWEGYENSPVMEISKFGAEAFCEWRGARLPTEAEWEKAARGGLEGAMYPWGDEEPVCQPGTFNGAQFIECAGAFIRVGSFKPNGYGLFDMVGNAQEWVADFYLKNFYEISPFENPIGPKAGTHYVLRSGHYTQSSGYIRVSNRISEKVSTIYFDQLRIPRSGFRCVRSP